MTTYTLFLIISFSFVILQELRWWQWAEGADTGGGRSQSLTQAPQEGARLRCEDDIQKCISFMLEK